MLGSQNMTDIESFWELVLKYLSESLGALPQIVRTFAVFLSHNNHILKPKSSLENDIPITLFSEDAQWLPVTLRANPRSFQAQGTCRVWPCSFQATPTGIHSSLLCTPATLASLCSSGLRSTVTSSETLPCCCI